MKIYFDMDGVLAHFDAVRPDGKDLNHPSEHLSPEKRAAKKAFWQEIEKQPNFWRDIPVMVNAEFLLITAFDMGEIFVLSKTPGSQNFLGGHKYVDFIADEKRKWIQKHLNKFFDKEHVIICDGPKGELIHPNNQDILIDDRQENINEWELHGGVGVLFTNAVDTAKRLVLLKSHTNFEPSNCVASSNQSTTTN